MRRAYIEFAVLLLVGALSLQLFFCMRIMLMRWIAPASSSFERSSLYQLAATKTQPWMQTWRQTWVPYGQISPHLKRAIIASEDASFTDHEGVDWSAIDKAWDKNKKMEKLAAKSKPLFTKTVGGSTITQQLAKNLFLSGERTYLRKAQEYVLALMLETLLTKEHIFEMYLNHAQWGESVFGAQAASHHYFGKSASALEADQSALLAVMLPRPKYFERRMQTSEYLQQQAAIVQARMGSVATP